MLQWQHQINAVFCFLLNVFLYYSLYPVVHHIRIIVYIFETRYFFCTHFKNQLVPLKFAEKLFTLINKVDMCICVGVYYQVNRNSSKIYRGKYRTQLLFTAYYNKGNRIQSPTIINNPNK